MPPFAAGELKLTGVAWSSLGNQLPGGNGLLRPGQVYRGRVEQIDADGAALLRVGGQTLRVVSELALGRGQELLLRMTAGGAHPGFSVLRVLPGPDQRQARPGAAANNYLGAAVQSLVSQQQPLSQLLRWLTSAAEPAGLTAAQLSQWHALLQLLSRPRDLVQPQVLQSTIEDNGLLLEPRMLAALSNPANFPQQLSGDLKLILWRLLASAGGQVDPALLQLLQGVAAEISLRQLHSIKQAESGHFHWAVDLPLSWNGQMVPVALTIRRENGLARTPQAASDSWQVEFALEIEPLGAMHVSMYLSAQRVSVSLEAERQAAVEQLATGLSQLEEALELQGFTVDTLLSRPRAEGNPGPGAADYSTLLAVKA
ncbi:MAG: flagellar hook-length control protein FliK [Halieaceae bacterium]